MGHEATTATAVTMSFYAVVSNHYLRTSMSGVPTTVYLTQCCTVSLVHRQVSDGSIVPAVGRTNTLKLSHSLQSLYTVISFQLGCVSCSGPYSVHSQTTGYQIPDLGDSMWQIVKDSMAVT